MKLTLCNPSTEYLKTLITNTESIINKLDNSYGRKEKPLTETEKTTIFEIFSQIKPDLEFELEERLNPDNEVLIGIYHVWINNAVTNMALFTHKFGMLTPYSNSVCLIDATNDHKTTIQYHSEIDSKEYIGILETNGKLTIKPYNKP